MKKTQDTPGKSREVGPRGGGAADAGDQTTIIGTGMTFEGEVQAAGPVVIGGRIDGTIRSDDTVTVLQGAAVRGPITAETVLIQGSVDGEITARDHLELSMSGRVRGDVTGARLSVAEGAFMQGRMKATEGTVKKLREKGGRRGA